MQEALKLIKDAKNVIILGGKDSWGDVFGAASALADFLKNMGKNAFAVIADNNLKSLDLFPLKDNVFHSIQDSLPFIISINKKNIEISGVTFNSDDDQYIFELYLKNGSLSKKDLSLNKKDFKPDLIITVGLSDRSDMIDLSSEYSQIFFDTPVINIDNKVENTRYGQVNLVYLTKSSCCEIVFELLKAIDELALSPAHTTSLLAGMVIETKNFMSPKTNPGTFDTAARLIERGADYKLIIEKLHQTKSFDVLKMAGFLLSKISFVQDLPLCYIKISEQERLNEVLMVKDLPQALSEIESNFFPGFAIIAFWENKPLESKINVVAIWRDRERLIKISKLIEGSALKRNFLVFNSSGTLKEVVKKILDLFSRQM